MKKYLLILLVILGFQLVVSATRSNETFTIYLVRHAEKNLATDDYADPPLTECGEQRAESLNNFFQEVPLDVVYSTEYKRTKSTARPTAKAKGIDITLYDSQDLKSFSKKLIDCEQDALVVGHSTTTGVLAGLLIGEDMGAFDLDIYNRVYQVVFYKNSGRLHLFHTAFDCNE